MPKEEITKSKSENPSPRERRYFSESARKLIVEEIDHGLSKADASRKYKVSQTSIFKWYARYSTHYQATLVTVVEHVSDSIKVKQLEAELEKTYGLLGRAKAELMFLEQIIEQANEELGCDLKKNTATLPYSTSTAKKKKDK